MRIDTDQAPEITKRLGTVGNPTVLVLDGNGKELRRSMGFQPPEKMLGFLKGK